MLGERKNKFVTIACDISLAYSVRHFRCFRKLQGSYVGTKIKTKVSTICKTATSMVSSFPINVGIETLI